MPKYDEPLTRFLCRLLENDILDSLEVEEIVFCFCSGKYEEFNEKKTLHSRRLYGREKKLKLKNKKRTRTKFTSLFLFIYNEQHWSTVVIFFTVQRMGWEEQRFSIPTCFFCIFELYLSFYQHDFFLFMFFIPIPTLQSLRMT